MAINDLTEEERQALVAWQERHLPMLGPTLSTKLFQLFLQNKSVADIAALNPGTLPGAILDARVRDSWDEKRREYLDHLYGTVLQRVMQTQTEAVQFTADLMAAAHRLYGPKLQKFIQSGEIKDLGEAEKLIQSLDAYRKVAEMLLKLTLQDKEKAPKDAPQRDIKWLPTAPPTKSSEEKPALPSPTAAPVVKQLPGSVEVVDSSLASQILDFLTKKDAT